MQIENFERLKIRRIMDTNIKRLTRSLSDRKIAGVCGGMGRYFAVDSTPIRIIFLIALLLGSVGFWAYLICWLVMPEGE